MRLFHRFRPAGSSDQDMTGLVKGEDWEVEERLVTFTEVPNLLTFPPRGSPHGPQATALEIRPMTDTLGRVFIPSWLLCCERSRKQFLLRNWVIAGSVSLSTIQIVAGNSLHAHGPWRAKRTTASKEEAAVLPLAPWETWWVGRNASSREEIEVMA
jgi:hypothetical protein